MLTGSGARSNSSCVDYQAIMLTYDNAHGGADRSLHVTSLKLEAVVSSALFADPPFVIRLKDLDYCSMLNLVKLC